MKKQLLIFIAILIIVPSCKYEDGPFISIYTKKERISGNKTFRSVIENGVDKTSLFDRQTLDFTKVGNFGWTFYSESGEASGFGGTWELISDKERLIMHIYEYERDTAYTYDWEIKRLTYADMHLERINEEGHLIRWELYQAF